MFLKYEMSKKGFCITECPFKQIVVGSCVVGIGSYACKRCECYKFEIPFLKIICCSHKKKESK